MGGTPLTYFHLHPNVAIAARRIPFPSLPRNSRYVVHKPTDWWGGREEGTSGSGQVKPGRKGDEEDDTKEAERGKYGWMISQINSLRYQHTTFLRKGWRSMGICYVLNSSSSRQQKTDDFTGHFAEGLSCLLQSCVNGSAATYFWPSSSSSPFPLFCSEVSRR